MQQARAGAAVLWCTSCDHFWREWADQRTGWVKVLPDGQESATPPGHAGCPQCGETYVVWENYPEWEKLNKNRR
jgi:hypothetical protein